MECKRFNTCSAAICPLDHSDKSIWFPTEDICSSNKFSKGIKWIKIQRRIKRKAGYRGVTIGYFDLDYLKSITKVTAKIRGMNPDEPGKYLKFDKIIIPNIKIKRKETDPRLLSKKIENLKKARLIKKQISLNSKEGI